MAELSVGIGANIDNLEKNLKKGEKDLIHFGKTGEKVGKGFSKFGGAAAKGAKGMDKLGKSTANAVPATQEFSRIIQDAPFGIQGVANNITQLTDQFGNLTRKTGSSGAALKLMIGTLTGPAGILLAVSAVTSLWVAYSKEIGELFGKQNRLKDAFKDSREEIGSNISKLTQLTSAINDTTLSETERKNLYDKIKKEYPEFLGKLDLEKAGRDNITTAINNERKAIIGLGIAKSLEAKKEPLYAQIAEAELKSAEQLLTSTDKAFIYGIADPDTRIKFRKELAAKNKKATIDDAEKSLADINNTVKSIVDKYGVSTANILDLDKGGKNIDKGKIQKKIKDALSFDDEVELLDLSNISIDQDELDKLLRLDLALADASGESLLSSIKSAYDRDLKDMGESLDSFNDKTKQTINVNKLFAESAGSAFDAISSSVSKSGTVLDIFLGSLISSVGKLISAYLATATASAIAGGAQSGAATGPGAIVTMPGFIATLVATVGSAFAAIPKFALGGYSGDNNLAMLNANELILRPMEQQALFNILKGGSIGNVGNSIPNDVGSEERLMSVIRGNDLHIISTRAGKKMSRFYNS